MRKGFSVADRANETEQAAGEQLLLTVQNCSYTVCCAITADVLCREPMNKTQAQTRFHTCNFSM